VHNVELYNLYASTDIIRVMKSSRVRWAGNVACVEKVRSAYKILIGKPEGKRPLRRRRHRWEINVRMDIRKIE